MNDHLVDRQVSLLIKNWDIARDIIKDSSDRTWKFRSWALTIWWAVVGYSVVSKQPQLLLYLLVFIGIVFFVEVPWRLQEEKFLTRANEIAKSLNAFANGDKEASGQVIISVNVGTSRFQDVRQLLTAKRLGFWGPYAALVVLTVYAWLVLR